MELIDSIKKQFPSTQATFNTLAGDNTNGILSCGFIRKQGDTGNDVDITFQHYGALLLLEGEGKYIDQDGTTTLLYPGCYVQRLPGRRHCTIVTANSNWLEVYVCFGRELYFAFEKIGAINSHKPVLKPGLDFLLIQKFLTLYEKLKTASVYQLPSLLSNAHEIVFLVHELDQRVSEPPITRLIEAACKHIHDNIKEDIRGYEVARQLGIGYERFRKLFKEQTGLPPNQYIIQKRIDTAKSMLQNTANKIIDIAQALGYSDAFTFSKQFKKLTGKSPTEFRREI